MFHTTLVTELSFSSTKENEFYCPEEGLGCLMFTGSAELVVRPGSPVTPTDTELNMTLEFAVITYRAVRDRIRTEDPQIDEQTLADTVEGLTDVHEILAALVRAALADEALANGLKGRIAEMQDRLERLQDCATKRRQIAKEVMVELDIKKIAAPDFNVSIRPGMPSLLIIDEKAVPSVYWQPVAPKLKRQELLSELKQGTEITGVTLSNPEPVLSVRTR